MAIVMGPGLNELAEWQELYGQKMSECLREKGYSEAALESIMIAGFTGIPGAVPAYFLAVDVEECDQKVIKDIGDRPYTEQEGQVTKDGNGYDVEIKWEWVDRTWPIDNEIKWTYKIHCNSDDADEYLSSFKIHFNDDVEDLFAQTSIPGSIKITCDGEVIDTATWTKTVGDKDIHWKVGEGFENLHAAKKCCTIELEMNVEADGFTDLGTAYITVNRGKAHRWGDGIPTPGPVLAAARTPEGSNFLASQRPNSIKIGSEFVHLSAHELLGSPISALNEISDEQAMALEEHFNIRSIKDLSLFRHSRLINAAKKIQRSASLREQKEKEEQLQPIWETLRHIDSKHGEKNE